MRIAIDARFALGPSTGVTNYLNNLLANLIDIDSQNEYVLYIHRKDIDNKIPEHPRFRKKIINAPSLLWKNVFLPIDIRREKIDIFHSPAYTIPITPVGKIIVTIHDVMHMVNPQWFTRKELFFIKYPFKFAAKRATKIIAVSETTKHDIMKFYGIPESKITVTLEAANGIYKPIRNGEKLSLVRKKYGIDGKFILYVGVLFKRRNISGLLEAFATLKKNNQIRHKLVIVGLDKGHFDLSGLINALGLKREVIYTGHVPNEEMPLLYNAAEIFVYPSFYEGFGLPVLEAMACGTPVITSNSSSLAEIAQDAALLINPYNVEQLNQAMLDLLSNENLRQHLSRSGVVRAQSFNWQRMAEQTLSIYKEVYKNNQPL